MRSGGIRIVALDLDGTLLDSEKRLSPRNRESLQRAADAGVEIVPTTGRFFGGMPEAIRELPFLRYAITVNGAEVYDVQNDAALCREEIPLALALEIMAYLDTLPVIYDCYQDGWGLMTESLQRQVDDFTDSPHYRRMIRELRTPVPELKAYLREKGESVQKIQFFVKDIALRDRELATLEDRFPAIAVSSSLVNNVEINIRKANKGDALLALAARLGVDPAATMAVGDGLNDLPMIRAAGLGVAMGNACPEILEAADAVTGSCDEDGVAAAIERFCL